MSCLPSKISEIVLRLESKLFEFSRHLFGRSSGHMANMSVTVIWLAQSVCLDTVCSYSSKAKKMALLHR